MSIKVSFEYLRPGDGRDPEWFEDYLDDVRDATGELGAQNVAEEGVQLRHFDDGEVPRILLGIDTSETLEVLAAQSYGPALAGAAVKLDGPFDLEPGERLRVRASMAFPTLIATPLYGIPSSADVGLRLTYDIDAVATPDLNSEVRIQPNAGTRESSPLTTFSTLYNDTEATIEIENIEPEFETDADIRIQYIRLEAFKYTRTT